jgi:hypothetical protein
MPSDEQPEQRIELVAEQLQVDKREVERARVVSAPGSRNATRSPKSLWSRKR